MPVSYTHLDVYKRQALILSTRLAILLPPYILTYNLILNTADYIPFGDTAVLAERNRLPESNRRIYSSRRNVDQ